MAREYVFGYGSLLSTESRERTAHTGAAVPARVRGFRRSWNVFSEKSNGVVLGVLPDAETWCAGALYAVDAPALRALDEREWSYDRVKVSSDAILAEGVSDRDVVWIYVPRAECLVPKEGSRVSSHYLLTVHRGCKEVAPSLWEAFCDDTQGWEYCSAAAADLGLSVPLVAR